VYGLHRMARGIGEASQKAPCVLPQFIKVATTQDAAAARLGGAVKPTMRKDAGWPADKLDSRPQHYVELVPSR